MKKQLKQALKNFDNFLKNDEAIVTDWNDYYGFVELQSKNPQDTLDALYSVKDIECVVKAAYVEEGNYIRIVLTDAACDNIGAV